MCFLLLVFVIRDEDTISFVWIPDSICLRRLGWQGILFKHQRLAIEERSEALLNFILETVFIVSKMVSGHKGILPSP